MKKILWAITTVIVFWTIPNLTLAVTLTFDDVSGGQSGCDFAGGNPDTIVERGFTISGCPEYHSLVGAVHLDDTGTTFGNSVTISTNRLFDAISLDVYGYGSIFLAPDNDGNDHSLAYNNVLFEGFINGVVVSTQHFSTGITGGLFSVFFESGFIGIDALTISQRLPSAAEFAAYPHSYCGDAPCNHIDIDNLVVSISPVPLPASVFLLLFAFVVLVLGKYWGDTNRSRNR